MIEFTEEQIYQIGQMADKGQTLREIANRMGCSTMKIRDEMIANGMKTINMGKRRPKKKPVVRKRFFTWSIYGEEGYLMIVGLPKQ